MEDVKKAPPKASKTLHFQNVLLGNRSEVAKAGFETFIWKAVQSGDAQRGKSKKER